MNLSRLILFFFLFQCCTIDETQKEGPSIYDYNEEITGQPINISIYESENIVYEINSDRLVDSLGSIILTGGVAIQVFNDKGLKTNDIFSEKAIVHSNTDSMSAYGNVEILSALTGDKLFTEKIIMFNTTQSVLSRDEILFINDGDSLTGYGFWSDFDMNNWRIDKPKGLMKKDDNE